MSKKQLYMIIGVLGVLLLVVLFMPVEKETVTQEEISILEESETVPVAPEKQPEKIVEVTDTEEFPEQVILEGEFLSLADGVNPWDKVFKYMLLHDGVEVLRVDLRPLIGYSDIDVIEKLGVQRGEKVRVVGIMEDGEFKVTSVAKQ